MKIEEIELTLEQHEKLEKDIALWGKVWADRRAYFLRVKAYVEAQLICERGDIKTPFRCYQEATDKYRRKDGLPLTDEDIKAIEASSHGQGSDVRGKAGDLEVLHKWFIDSSD